jgi:large subunit ribosomal protein L7Ae
VKWPKYIRVQKQKAILQQRLKVPGTVNQFTKTADSNTAQALFKFLHKYRPETKSSKKQRLFNAAKDAAEKLKKEKEANKEKKEDVQKKATVPPKPAPKPKVVKYGLNHVTRLVETKKAKLVLIAHDVDPLELVLWLPTLCKKKRCPLHDHKIQSKNGNSCPQKNFCSSSHYECQPQG